MPTENPTSTLNLTDPKVREQLMDQFGNTAAMFEGTNENGEKTTTYITPNKIAHYTLLKNGRRLLTTYLRSGTRLETCTSHWKHEAPKEAIQC